MLQPPGPVLSHWSQLIENLDARPSDFYSALRDAINRREIPGAELSEVEYQESGALSARRLYLRAQRSRYVMDCCGAPFGRGFFVSWWLTEIESRYGWLALLGVLFGLFGYFWLFTEIFGAALGFLLALIALPFVLQGLGRVAGEHAPKLDAALAAMPYLGWAYNRWIRPETFYRVDTALMYRDAVHNSMLEVLDQMTESQGLRTLSEAERKPVHTELLQKRMAA